MLILQRTRPTQVKHRMLLYGFAMSVFKRQLIYLFIFQECEEERMNKFLRVSTPFVCRYNTVSQLNDMGMVYICFSDKQKAFSMSLLVHCVM